MDWELLALTTAKTVNNNILSTAYTVIQEIRKSCPNLYKELDQAGREQSISIINQTIIKYRSFLREVAHREGKTTAVVSTNINAGIFAKNF